MIDSFHALNTQNIDQETVSLIMDTEGVGAERREPVALTALLILARTTAVAVRI